MFKQSRWKMLYMRKRKDSTVGVSQGERRLSNSLPKRVIRDYQQDDTRRGTKIDTVKEKRRRKEERLRESV